MRGTHQHHEVSPEEIQAIVDRQPEAKATDKPSNRNTRWFAEVALVKNELQRLGDLMLPSGKDLSAMMEEEMPLRDLYKRLYIVSKKSFNTDDEDHVEALIERRMGEVQDAARSCKDRLQAMKHEIEAFRVELGPDYSGSEVKMRQTMHGSLCKRLHKLVHEFQAMQVERKEQYVPLKIFLSSCQSSYIRLRQVLFARRRYKKGIMQQVKAVLRGKDGGQVDDEELNAAVEECMVDGSDPFAKLHVGGAQWHKAEATLNDVREKHADIIRLERGELRCNLLPVFIVRVFSRP